MVPDTCDAEATRTARELFALNKERQTAERAIVAEILQHCIEIPVTDDDAALVFWGEGWHRGVAGIVASRVVEKFNRPAIVMGVENGVANGSGRSTGNFHLLDALESVRDLLTKFGGHAHAAGLTLPESSLEEFRRRLRMYAAARLTPEDRRRTVSVDALVNLAELDDTLWLALEQIAPFGMENPKVLFGACGVELAGPPQVWKEKHLKIVVKQGTRSLLIKAWGMADLAEELKDVRTIDVAFEIERGWSSGWDLTARACRPSS